MNTIKSVYIHIPFCEKICHYCDFVKFFYNETLANEYLDALINEINTNIAGEKNHIDTIYIGGGTPSALNIQQLKKLLEFVNKKFDVVNCKEFSIEVNPGDIDDDKTKILKEYGITRISFGVQTMDDGLLEQLGRAHRSKDVYNTIGYFHKYNLSNVSLDLMFALPHQSVQQFEQTLDEVLDFELPHYSSYGLQIEPKTVFYIRHQKGQLHRPSEEEEVHMYEMLRQKMEENGKKQYEISNFAVPGFESKHNLTYWSNQFYYGFGAGAHAYLPGRRIANIRALPAYVKKALADGKPILKTDRITIKEKIEEEMFLGLRRIKGVNKNEFNHKFDISIDDLYGQIIEQLITQGLIIETDGQIRLTSQGLLLSNRVFEQFMLQESDISSLSQVQHN